MNEDEGREIMQKAYRMIKAGRKSEGFDLLFPLTETFPENAALWWLIAQAMVGRSNEDAIVALENVQTLQPDHEPSARLLQRLR